MSLYASERELLRIPVSEKIFDKLNNQPGDAVGDFLLSLRRRLGAPQHARFSRVGVEIRAQLLPAAPVGCWDAMQRSAHKKFCAEPTALFSSRTSRPFVPQWN